jgi:16S rRNA (uracil1498-N3)-methyltransferase
MVLPFFYIPAYDSAQSEIMLDENTSRHIVQVLRMAVGERLQLTDGRGNLLTADISSAHKKHCLVSPVKLIHKSRDARKVTIAISLLKNTDRFEWFIEKATEIGVSEIIPFISGRTEKKQYRKDRLKTILLSAMIQSQQVWLPDLQELQSFPELIRDSKHAQKFIAHCREDARVLLSEAMNRSAGSQIILIGPEGDFSAEEVSQAIQSSFIPVTLGETRLRSETAGVVAVSLLRILQ